VSQVITLKHALRGIRGARERLRRLLIGRIERGMLEAARHTQAIIPIAMVKGFGDALWVDPFT